ncbi:hypothetical protein LIER_36952 [Lithospermum erythrorhizon]|uniref:Reverse transcriptase n=1 Tax=Lithospermum erythrorhizon TaxID=34254 RepID=A0AAV3PD46_LITER
MEFHRDHSNPHKQEIDGGATVFRGDVEPFCPSRREGDGLKEINGNVCNNNTSGGNINLHTSKDNERNVMPRGGKENLQPANIFVERGSATIIANGEDGEGDCTPGNGQQVGKEAIDDSGDELRCIDQGQSFSLGRLTERSTNWCVEARIDEEGTRAWMANFVYASSIDDVRKNQLQMLRWIGKEGCEEVIKEAWGKEVRGSRWFVVSEKIKQVRMGLIAWCKRQNLNSRHFDSIFRANDHSNPELATRTVNHQVSEEMNQQLTRVVTCEEVKRVVFEMPADKSPGPDEWLTCMIREAKDRKTIRGIKISRDSPSVSHILFADDTFIFLSSNPTREHGSGADFD